MSAAPMSVLPGEGGQPFVRRGLHLCRPHLSHSRSPGHQDRETAPQPQQLGAAVQVRAGCERLGVEMCRGEGRKWPPAQVTLPPPSLVQPFPGPVRPPGLLTQDLAMRVKPGSAGAFPRASLGLHPSSICGSCSVVAWLSLSSPLLLLCSEGSRALCC